MRRDSVILPLLLSFSGLCYAQKGCFYPNGVRAGADFPCDPEAADSACCGVGEVGTVCLTNGLCRRPNGNIIRGSCTDRSWNSPECPKFCLGRYPITSSIYHTDAWRCPQQLEQAIPAFYVLTRQSGAAAGGSEFISCANVTATDTSYCCIDHPALCCDEGVSRFDVPSKPDLFANWDVGASRFIVVDRTKPSGFSPSSSHGSTTLTSSSPTSSPTSDLSAQSSPPAAPPLSVGAQAGIGALAGALAIAIAAVVFLLVKLRKKTALLAEMESEQTGQQYTMVVGPEGYAGGGQGKVEPETAWHGHTTSSAAGMGPGVAVLVPPHEMDTQGTTYELPSSPGPQPRYM